MTEIELKARVADRDALIARLDAIADFAGSVTRDDTYWGLPAEAQDAAGAPARRPKIRIRREVLGGAQDGGRQGRILLTYKRKELRTGGAHAEPSEVNDEKECTVSDAAPLEAFLADNGFCVQLEKHKDVMDWTFPLARLAPHTPRALPPDCAALTATFELCTVPPLGDFLEIEILSPRDDARTVTALQEALSSLLEQAGLPQSAREPRYYSELLAELPGASGTP